MPTSANCPKNPGVARADVGIRAPILPLSQRPYVAQTFLSAGSGDFPVARPSPTFNHTRLNGHRELRLENYRGRAEASQRSLKSVSGSSICQLRDAQMRD